jgi:hypothetical protein
MNRTKYMQPPVNILHLLLMLFIIVIINIGLTMPIGLFSRAADTGYVLKTTITSPPAGMTYNRKDKATVKVSVEHTFPISRVVFRLRIGNTIQPACAVTTEPFICTYIVPGIGTGTGSKSGYTIEVFTYDTKGHITTDSIGLWSYK